MDRLYVALLPTCSAGAPPAGITTNRVRVKKAAGILVNRIMCPGGLGPCRIEMVDCVHHF